MKALVAAALCVAAVGAPFTQAVDPGWTSKFDVERSELASTGRNPYFVLSPGYVLTLEDGRTRLVVSVLNETKTVDGVETRIVEERESKDNQPVEVSRNYFAISTRTNAVYYFGEDVDMYKNGKVVGHEGAWLAGVNGARFGLAMPGSPALRVKYYQEIAPKVAMDRGEIVSLTEKLRVPAGAFTDVLKIAETTPLEPGVKEYKYYGRGIGLLQDGSLKLVKYGSS
jgi:hypothetical protein